jgi:hypothetical protein
MPPRLISVLATFLLLLVSSGAALLMHDRLDHSHVAEQSMTTSAVVGATSGATPDGNIHERAALPTRPLHPHSREDCPTCDQLLHLAAVAALLLFVFGLLAAAIIFRPPSVAWPVLAAIASPRSSRGPPLFA